MTPDPTIDILHLQQQWGGTVRRAATAADVAIATAAVTRSGPVPEELT